MSSQSNNTDFGGGAAHKATAMMLRGKLFAEGKCTNAACRKPLTGDDHKLPKNVDPGTVDYTMCANCRETARICAALTTTLGHNIQRRHATNPSQGCEATASGTGQVEHALKSPSTGPLTAVRKEKNADGDEWVELPADGEDYQVIDLPQSVKSPRNATNNLSCMAPGDGTKEAQAIAEEQAVARTDGYALIDSLGVRAAMRAGRR